MGGKRSSLQTIPVLSCSGGIRYLFARRLQKWGEAKVWPNYEEDLDWFSTNYSKLREAYCNQWIAVAEKRVVGNGSSVAEAVEEARRQGFLRVFVTMIPGNWEWDS